MVKRSRRGVLPVKAVPRHANVHGVVYVSPSTPFVAALKRIDRRLGKARGARVRVIGLGRAAQTALQIAAGLRERNLYIVEVRTVSATAVDELVDEQRGESSLVERPLAGVELLIRSRDTGAVTL